APAQSVWTGAGGNGDWNNVGNWTTVPTSSATTVLLFAGTSQLNTNQNIANPLDLNSLSFDVSAGAFVINTGALRFQANGPTAPLLSNDSLATMTFNNPVIFNATGSIGGTGTGGLVFGPLTVAQGTLTVGRNGVTTGSLTIGDPTATTAATLSTGTNTL